MATEWEQSEMVKSSGLGCVWLFLKNPEVLKCTRQNCGFFLKGRYPPNRGSFQAQGFSVPIQCA